MSTDFIKAICYSVELACWITCSFFIVGKLCTTDYLIVGALFLLYGLASNARGFIRGAEAYAKDHP